ncbi:MAG: transglycosylase family protein [Thermoleophilia bacterium]
MDSPLRQRPAAGARRLLRAALAGLGGVVVVGAIAALTGSAAPATERIDARREQIRTLEAEVARIDAAAAEAADAHAAAARREESLRVRLAETTAGLADARRAHDASVQRLSDRMVAIYSTREPSLVEVLLTSGDLSDALDVRDALERIGRTDAAIIEGLRATRARLRALQAELREGRREAEAQVAAQGERLADLQGLISDRRAVLDDAQEQLGALIRAEERRDRAAAAARRAARDGAAAEARAERDLRRRAEPDEPAPAPAAPATPSAPSGGGIPSDVAAHLARIAQCESGGNPRAVSSTGMYRGKYQFARSTWEGLGGVGDPAAAPEAEQDRLAAKLYAQSGPAPWPVCGYR